MVKRFVGIGKRSHHSSLLKALSVPHVSDIVSNKTVALFQRFFKVNSPLVKLYSFMMARYMLYGAVTKGSMLDRIVCLGLSPMQVIFSKSTFNVSESPHEDGITDSLKYLTMHEHFIKPWSEEHILAVLLTRSF